MANFGRPGMGRGSFGGFLSNTPIIRGLLYANVGLFLFEMFFSKLPSGVDSLAEVRCG